MGIHPIGVPAMLLSNTVIKCRTKNEIAIKNITLLKILAVLFIPTLRQKS